MTDDRASTANTAESIIDLLCTDEMAWLGGDVHPQYSKPSEGEIEWFRSHAC